MSWLQRIDRGLFRAALLNIAVSFVLLFGGFDQTLFNYSVYVLLGITAVYIFFSAMVRPEDTGEKG